MIARYRDAMQSAMDRISLAAQLVDSPLCPPAAQPSFPYSRSLNANSNPRNSNLAVWVGWFDLYDEHFNPLNIRQPPQAPAPGTHTKTFPRAL